MYRRYINSSCSFNLFPFSAQVTNVSCPGSADGIIDIQVNSGVAPFQYSIDGGQNFQFNNVFDQLESGEYIIVVLDGNNCSVSQYITVAALQVDNAIIETVRMLHVAAPLRVMFG